MRMIAQRIMAVLLAATMLITTLPSLAFAQEGEALPVLILPVDQANFLPGSYFDVRVEVHADALPDDFAVTIDGVDASEFLGIVTTADWTDATPAAVFAHTRRRGDQAFIAAAAIDEGLQPEVILGGGAQWMLPQSAAGSRSEDERDLFAEYEALGYSIVTSATELADAVSADTPKRLLGMFHPSNMSVWLDRNVFTDNLGDFPDQPGLVEMTEAALEVLSQNPNGFYLQIEAASVDKQMHPLDMDRTLADLIEFDNALAAAIEWAATNAPDTLIVVTADHGHGFDVYGTVDVEAFNAATDDAGKRAAIDIYQEAGFPTYVDEDGDFFPDSWNVSRVLAGIVNNHPDYTEDFQVSATPRVPAIRNDDGVYVDNPDDDPDIPDLHHLLDIKPKRHIRLLRLGCLWLLVKAIAHQAFHFPQQLLPEPWPSPLLHSQAAFANLSEMST